jgi:hypothetical protein
VPGHREPQQLSTTMAKNQERMEGTSKNRDLREFVRI